MALVTCPCAFRLRRLARNGCRGISGSHFPSKIQHKMALVKCPCAFPLRRLAWNGVLGRGVRHFPSKFLHLLWHVHAHFGRAGSHKGPLGRGIFLVDFRKNGSCDMSMCILAAHARTKRDISYRNLAKRPLIGSLHRDLAKRPLIEILFRDLARRLLTEILPTELL